MSIGYVTGLRTVLTGFRTHPPGQRLHILIRYLTCPFTRFVGDVPPGARLLDIGGGHGVFALLALKNGARQVVVVDPDLRKSLAASPSPAMWHVAGYDEAIRGTFDAAVICDVLYHMPLDAHPALFARIFSRLRPGGVLIVKEIDPGRRLKLRWSRFQEWVVDTFLHLTHGSGFTSPSREEFERMLTQAGFTSFTARAVDAGYPYAHIVYTAKKPL